MFFDDDYDAFPKMCVANAPEWALDTEGDG